MRAQLRVGEPIADVNLDSDRILVRVGRAAIRDAGGREMVRSSAAPRPGAIDPDVRERRSAARGRRPGGDERATTSSTSKSARSNSTWRDRKSRVDLAAKIVSAGDGRVAAAQVFAAEAPVGSTGARGGRGGAEPRAVVGHDADRRVRLDAPVRSAPRSGAGLRRANRRRSKSYPSRPEACASMV